LNLENMKATLEIATVALSDAKFTEKIIR